MRGGTFQSLLMQGANASSVPPISLMLFNGSNGDTSTTDSASARSWTFSGNAVISTATPPPGSTSSLALDGTGDWVQTTGSVSGFNFQDGDFTVEAWVKTTKANSAVVDCYLTGDFASWQLFIGSDGKVYWYHGLTYGVIKQSSSSVINGAWRHIAVSYSSGLLRFFVDGIFENSFPYVQPSDTYTNVNTPIAIGAQVRQRNSDYDFNGQIGPVRITLACLYTANFTPPTSF